MPISETTTTSSAQADETDFTSLESGSPALMAVMNTERPIQTKKPPPTNTKQPPTQTKPTASGPATAKQPAARVKTTPSTKGERPVTHTNPMPTNWFQNRPLRRPYSSKQLITIGNMPSNAQLKSMNSKPFISIRWKERESGEAVMLYESFPKALAIAFSENCRQSTGTGVVIVGGVRLRIKKVFDFMLESAKGHGCSAPPIPEQLRYCTYDRAACDASWVNVPLLEDEYAARRTIIEKMQVHSDDVEKIYRDETSKGTEVREKAAESVARKMASKTLKAYPVYIKLRAELPEFDADIKKVLRVIRKPLEEEKRRVMKETQQQAQRQAWAQQQREARQGQAARRENGATFPRMNAVSHAKVLPTRIVQTRGLEKVQTSLGVIWAAVPVEKDARGKGTKVPIKKKAMEASESSANKVNDMDDKKVVVCWADEMAGLSDGEDKPGKERAKGGPNKREET